MRVLGLDIGKKRIGVAVSDETRVIAQNLTFIKNISDKAVIAEIKALVTEYDVSRIVIGLPLYLDGSEGDMADFVRDMGGKIGTATGIEVIMWDERFTTKCAVAVLISAGVSRKKRKILKDKVAAQLILQEYLESAA